MVFRTPSTFQALIRASLAEASSNTCTNCGTCSSKMASITALRRAQSTKVQFKPRPEYFTEREFRVLPKVAEAPKPQQPEWSPKSILKRPKEDLPWSKDDIFQTFVVV